MKSKQRKLLFIGAIIGLLGVAFGAFGAHALKELLSEAARHQYDLGVRYAFIHALAIMAAGLALPITGNPVRLNLAAWFFIGGVVLFSGSLLLLALTGFKLVAILTPLGGLCFLLGWGLFAYTMRGE